MPSPPSSPNMSSCATAEQQKHWNPPCSGRPIEDREPLEKRQQGIQERRLWCMCWRAASYIAASRAGRGGVASTSSFLCICVAAKIIARSARAVIVKRGLTPIAEGTAAPSHT